MKDLIKAAKEKNVKYLTDKREIVKKIINGSTVTVKGQKRAYLDKWHPEKPAIEIPNSYAQTLIFAEILVLHSGNWGTGEEHYSLTGYECETELIKPAWKKRPEQKNVFIYK